MVSESLLKNFSISLKLTDNQMKTRILISIFFINFSVLSLAQRFEGGIGFGYLFSFSEKDENGPLPSVESVRFKPFELSGQLGMKYALTEHLSANIRFSYSFLPVMDYGQTTAKYFRSGAFNNLFNISIYYALFR